MSDAPPLKTSSFTVSRFLRRLLPLVVAALLFSLLLPRIVRGSFAGEGKPGFGRGVVQGALMPMALPHLLLGKDVPIYAPENADPAPGKVPPYDPYGLRRPSIAGMLDKLRAR